MSDGLSEIALYECPPEKPWCPVRDPASWGLKEGDSLYDFKTGKLTAFVSSIRDGYVWVTDV